MVLAAALGVVSALAVPELAAASGEGALPGTQAWIYPGRIGQATCRAPLELSRLAAHAPSVVKPQWLQVTRRGTVSPVTAGAMPCNGFSRAALAQLRAGGRHVVVSVEADPPGVGALLATPEQEVSGARAIAAFVRSNRLAGAELNFAPTSWSSSTWASYVTFIATLSQLLPGETLEVDMNAWTSTPPDAERYLDPVLAGAKLVIMGFDHQYVVPCSPLAPFSWIKEVIGYVKSQVPLTDVTFGLPSYGYRASSCSSVGAVRDNVPYVTMQQAPGFPATPQAVAAHRDPGSGEIRWRAGHVLYDVVDAEALRAKLHLVERLGVSSVSVWSLGGNPWFGGNPS